MKNTQTVRAAQRRMTRLFGDVKPVAGRVNGSVKVGR